MNNPTSLQLMSRDIVLRRVHYVNKVNDAFINRCSLIPRNDIAKLLASPYLLPECGDKYFMKYLLDNPDRGILYATRYGVLSLFELLFKKRYTLCINPSHYATECYKTYKSWHPWPEVEIPREGIRLATAAVVGGNIDILTQVFRNESNHFNVDIREMMIVAIHYERDAVITFLFDKLRSETIVNQKYVLYSLISEAIKKNVATRILIKLFSNIKSYYKDVDIGIYKIQTCLYELLIEFGFRRDTEFHNIIIDDEDTMRYDLNSHTTDVHRINLAFIKDLLNGEFVKPENDEVIIYSIAFVVVCISKKRSLDLFKKLFDCMISAFSKLSPFEGVYDIITNVYFEAISHVIESMENDINFNSIADNYVSYYVKYGKWYQFQSTSSSSSSTCSSNVDRRLSDANDIFGLIHLWSAM